MTWVIYLIGSGAVFFAGVIGVMASALLASTRSGQRWPRTLRLVAVLGCILVAASAVPLPLWLYGVLFAAVLFWFVAEHGRPAVLQSCRVAARLAVILISLVFLAYELPYQATPTLPPLGRPPVTIFGDSVAAGMGNRNEETWVNLLAKDHALTVHNYSRPGGTVGMALRKAREVELPGGIVLLEIGGNDLLGVTSAADFERNLDELLECVCGANRIVLMFELPLPPLRNEFGAIQRALTAKHGVRLIPKRVLIGVLTAGDATHDGIHLTPHGHALMTETVWRLLEPAYRDP